MQGLYSRDTFSGRCGFSSAKQAAGENEAGQQLPVCCGIGWRQMKVASIADLFSFIPTGITMLDACMLHSIKAKLDEEMKSLIDWLPSALRKNMFWLALARFSALVLSVFVVAVVARRLGPVEFGRYSFFIAALMVGNTFTTFGTETMIVRETAKLRQVAQTAGQALGLQVALSVVWLCGLALLQMDVRLLVLSLSLFPFAWLSVSTAVLRGFERMDLFWLIVLINSSLQLVSALLAWDLASLSIILLFGNTLASISAIWIASASLPHFRLPLRLDFGPIVRLSLPFALVTVTVIALQRLGIFFATKLLDGNEAGLFSAAARFYEGLKFGHYAVLGALLPALSQTIESPRPHMVRNLLLSLMGFSLLVAGAVSIASPLIVRILFGAEYLPASDLVVAIVWSLIPYTISAAISVQFVARNLEGVLAGISLVNLFIAFGLFTWLVTNYGTQGAVYATLISESIQAVLSVFFWNQYIRRSG